MVTFFIQPLEVARVPEISFYSISLGGTKGSPCLLLVPLTKENERKHLLQFIRSASFATSRSIVNIQTFLSITSINEERKFTKTVSTLQTDQKSSCKKT